MRAFGRLSGANFEFETKHPILMSAKHPAMQLMLLNCHLDSNHQADKSMQYEKQQSVGFWVSEKQCGALNVAV